MTITAKIDVDQGNLLSALQHLLQDALALESVGAILVSQLLPNHRMVMPALITASDQLEGVDPLAPAYPLNAAKIASRLTRKSAGVRTLLVLRPCEIRAFVELVKLNQGHMDDVVILGIDCLGAYSNRDYLQFVNSNPEDGTRRFYESVLGGNGTALAGADLTTACRMCIQPFPDGADVAVGLLGLETTRSLPITAQTEKGEQLLKELRLETMAVPHQRQEAVDKLLSQRKEERNRKFTEIRAVTENLEKLSGYLAACVNCYNCRVACPVCYCRECVFVTDVFDHEPVQYLQWATRKGRIKMPTDTVFYHLTRLAHMSTACVSCGQCSNACPNDIPLAELFSAVAQSTQQAFDYLAGRNVEEPPPLSEFRENEFQEIVGI